jgi:hypothetical protein
MPSSDEDKTRKSYSCDFAGSSDELAELITEAALSTDAGFKLRPRMTREANTREARKTFGKLRDDAILDYRNECIVLDKKKAR